MYRKEGVNKSRQGSLRLSRHQFTWHYRRWATEWETNEVPVTYMQYYMANPWCRLVSKPFKMAKIGHCKRKKNRCLVSSCAQNKATTKILWDFVQMMAWIHLSTKENPDKEISIQWFFIKNRISKPKNARIQLKSQNWHSFDLYCQLNFRLT